MVLSVLRNPSPLRRGALLRLVFFTLMIFQSPMTHSAGGSPISPLQVVAKFFKQQQQLAKSVPVHLTRRYRTIERFVAVTSGPAVGNYPGARLSPVLPWQKMDGRISVSSKSKVDIQ